MARRMLIPFESERRDDFRGYDVPSRWRTPVAPPEGTTFRRSSHSTPWGRIIVKPLSALGDRELASCLQLNLGLEMLRTLRTLIKYNRGEVYNRTMVRDLSRAHVVLAKNIHGKVIGWCLLFRSYEGLNVHTYVDSGHRRRGVGRALLSVVEDKFPEGMIHPWDSDSRAFYAQSSLRVAPGRYL